MRLLHFTRPQAKWALTSEKAAVRANRGRRLETEKNELELANIELVARRSARLKEFYQQLDERYDMCVCLYVSDGVA